MSSGSRLLSTSLTAGKSAVPAVVGARGIRLQLADGRWVIDASNTAAPLGHAHPEVVEALRGGLESPALNEGWGWGERNSAAEELLGIAFAGEESWVGAVRFFLSGSEANDAILSLAQALTGRTPLATRERAYHGGSGLAREMTVQPHWHGGLTFAAGGVREVPRSAVINQLPMPVGARMAARPGPFRVLMSSTSRSRSRPRSCSTTPRAASITCPPTRIWSRRRPATPGRSG